MSKYRQTMAEALQKVYEQDKDHEISMARGELEAIADKATQLSSALQGKTDDGNPLEAWVQSKITKAKDYINSVSDYLMYNPEQAKEELGEAKIVSDISGVSISKLKKEVQPFNVKVGRVGPGMDSDYEVEFIGSEQNLIKYAKSELGFEGNSFRQLKKDLNMEDVDLEEGKMKTIATMFDQGKSAEEIAKALKLSISTVKTILGEGINPYVSMQKDDKTGRTKYVVLDKDEKEAFSSFEYKVAQDYMKKNYNKLKEVLEEKIQPFMISYNKNGQHAGFEGGNSLSDIQNKAQKLRAKGFTIDKMGRYNPPVKDKTAVYTKDNIRNMIKEEEMPKEEPKKDNEQKESENKDKEIASLKDQISMLKQKLENEKNKAIKPEPNPETGEVPLTIGIAHAEFKKQKEKVNESASQVQVRRDGKGNFNLTYRGKEIGYYHKERGKYVVYHSKEDGEYSESDEVSTEMQAKKLAYDNMKEENITELSKAEKQKRLQRAKDMIKYYDMMKKRALKGPNKELAKKMLKSDLNKDDENTVKKIITKLKGASDAHAGQAKDLEKALKSEAVKNLEEKTYDEKEIDKFHTDLDKIVHKHFGHSSKEKEEMDEKVADSIIKDLQKAYAPLKGKTISPEMANKMSKHLDGQSYDVVTLRQLVKAKIPFISTIARNKIYKKTGRFEDRRLYVEAIAGLQKKADKSGMPYSILKKVYDRGMAAWKSGHRPGASQQQWAFARVNSFITKSSGTWGGADKDLAAKVKGSK